MGWDPPDPAGVMNFPSSSRLTRIEWEDGHITFFLGGGENLEILEKKHQPSTKNSSKTKMSFLKKKNIPKNLDLDEDLKIARRKVPSGSS